jgi:hypothetical protein
MGASLTSIPHEIASKMGETQKEMQTTMMRRQSQMQVALQKRMMAATLARARDLLMFQGAFLSILTPLLIVGALRKKNPALLGPLLPLGFVFAYQYDLAYGTKLLRIRKEAEHIMSAETPLLDLPNGVPTIHEIDRAVALQMVVEEQQAEGRST